MFAEHCAEEPAEAEEAVVPTDHTSLQEQTEDVARQKADERNRCKILTVQCPGMLQMVHVILFQIAPALWALCGLAVCKLESMLMSSCY